MHQRNSSSEQITCRPEVAQGISPCLQESPSQTLPREVKRLGASGFRSIKTYNIRVVNQSKGVYQGECLHLSALLLHFPIILFWSNLPVADCSLYAVCVCLMLFYLACKIVSTSVWMNGQSCVCVVGILTVGSRIILY